LFPGAGRHRHGPGADRRLPARAAPGRRDGTGRQRGGPLHPRRRGPRA
jgi:hypothetical protein